MPARTLYRTRTFDIHVLFNQFLSGQPGWSAVDDIAFITWDPVGGILKIIHVPESNLVRTLSLTRLEIYALLSNLPGWQGGTAVDIANIVYDPAGQKITVYKTIESA